MARSVVMAAVVLAVACGGGGGGPDDDAAPMSPYDAAVEFDAPEAIDADAVAIDAPSAAFDAAPDLADSGLAGVTGDPSQQVTSASGTVVGGVYRVEVQFGHAVPQRRTTGGSYQASGATPLNP